MALLKRLLSRKPLSGLLEISERVYVFECCFSTETLDEDEFRDYLNSIITRFHDLFPDASLMVFNFHEGNERSQIAGILSECDITVMDYPRRYEGCPLLPLEMIHHFLRSSESWLSLEGKHNILLLHCEKGGWPVLAFVLAGLLLYQKHFSREQKALESAYKHAPKELLHFLCPVNPQPSHLRYLQYVSKLGSTAVTAATTGPKWPPHEEPYTLECLILTVIPNFDSDGGCRPMVRVFGQDPSMPGNKSSKVLFATQKNSKHLREYKRVESTPIRMDIRCDVQGDVAVECMHVQEDMEREEVMFRFMFHTAFVQSQMLVLGLDEVDVVWAAGDLFPDDFRVQVLFSDCDASESEPSGENISIHGHGHVHEPEGASAEAAEELFSDADNMFCSDWEYDEENPTRIFCGLDLLSTEITERAANQVVVVARTTRPDRPACATSDLAI